MWIFREIVDAVIFFFTYRILGSKYGYISRSGWRKMRSDISRNDDRPNGDDYCW